MNLPGVLQRGFLVSGRVMGRYIVVIRVVPATVCLELMSQAHGSKFVAAVSWNSGSPHSEWV